MCVRCGVNFVLVIVTSIIRIFNCCVASAWAWRIESTRASFALSWVLSCCVSKFKLANAAWCCDLSLLSLLDQSDTCPRRDASSRRSSSVFLLRTSSACSIWSIRVCLASISFCNRSLVECTSPPTANPPVRFRKKVRKKKAKKKWGEWKKKEGNV